MIPPGTVLSLPEWYCLERETEKITSKLTSVKELDFYLRHPDEYIRRLAIIRLSVLKPKGIENVLGDLLDNSLESSKNKELAAWVIKAAALKWDTEILINHRYLTRYTGNEKLAELFRITHDPLQPTFRFNFHPAPSYAQELPEQDTMADVRNMSFDAVFPLKAWLQGLSCGFFSSLKALSLSLLKCLPAAFGFIFTKLRQARQKAPLQPEPMKKSSGLYNKTYDNPDIMPLIMHSRASGAPRFSFINSVASLIKKVVFNVLYILFFPVRFVLKHKLAILCIITILYVFLNFSDYGKAVFSKYFGKDFAREQSKVVDTIRNFSYSLRDEFTAITGLEDALEKNRNSIDAADSAKPAATTTVYSVTAEKGLNIRKAPDAASEKIPGGPLSFGSTVTYLNKNGMDKAGKVWYFILAGDGRSGWVSASYLKLIEKG